MRLGVPPVIELPNKFATFLAMKIKKEFLKKEVIYLSNAAYLKIEGVDKRHPGECHYCHYVHVHLISCRCHWVMTRSKNLPTGFVHIIHILRSILCDLVLLGCDCVCPTRSGKTRI